MVVKLGDTLVAHPTMLGFGITRAENKNNNMHGTTTTCTVLPQHARYYHNMHGTTTTCTVLPQHAQYYPNMHGTTTTCTVLPQHARYYHNMHGTTTTCTVLPQQQPKRRGLGIDTVPYYRRGCNIFVPLNKGQFGGIYIISAA